MRKEAALKVLIYELFLNTFYEKNDKTIIFSDDFLYFS